MTKWKMACIGLLLLASAPAYAQQTGPQPSIPDSSVIAPDSAGSRVHIKGTIVRAVVGVAAVGVVLSATDKVAAKRLLGGTWDALVWFVRAMRAWL
ncbi:MAG: hypothetical protein V4550_05025 [Gemmatimonadota bacterium]